MRCIICSWFISFIICIYCLIHYLKGTPLQVLVTLNKNQKISIKVFSIFQTYPILIVLRLRVIWKIFMMICMNEIRFFKYFNWDLGFNMKFLDVAKMENAILLTFSTSRQKAFLQHFQCIRALNFVRNTKFQNKSLFNKIIHGMRHIEKI